MFTPKALIEYISEYVKACNDLGIYFSKVILFGSYARNTPHKWSDIDLALVSDSFTGFRPDDRGLIAPATIHFCDIEPHTFPTKYFEKGDPFIEEIKLTGKELKILETA